MKGVLVNFKLGTVGKNKEGHGHNLICSTVQYIKGRTKKNYETP
jgi:hypothetical protein